MLGVAPPQGGGEEELSLLRPTIIKHLRILIRGKPRVLAEIEHVAAAIELSHHSLGLVGLRQMLDHIARDRIGDHEIRIAVSDEKPELRIPTKPAVHSNLKPAAVPN